MNKIERNTKRSKKIPVIAVIIFAVAAVVGFYFYKQSQEKIRFPVGNSDSLFLYRLDDDAFNTFYNTWNKMMREVNAYRNSRQFSRDGMTTRGAKIYEILAKYEGNVIEEGSLEVRGYSVTGTTIPYGESFYIGYRDAEYYYEFYMTHN